MSINIKPNLTDDEKLNKKFMRYVEDISEELDDRPFEHKFKIQKRYRKSNVIIYKTEMANILLRILIINYL